MNKIQPYNNSKNFSLSFGLKHTPCIFKKTQEMLNKSIKAYRIVFMDIARKSCTDKLVLNDSISKEIRIVDKRVLNLSLNSVTHKGTLITYDIDKNNKIWLKRTKNKCKIIYKISAMNIEFFKIKNEQTMSKLLSECSFLKKIIINKKVQNCIKELFSPKNKKYQQIW